MGWVMGLEQGDVGTLGVRRCLLLSQESRGTHKYFPLGLGCMQQHEVCHLNSIHFVKAS